MIFAEELTPPERDKLLAKILAEISPPKKPRPKSLPKTNANMHKYCKPPDGCFSCPFPDCVAQTGTSGFGKRTDKEFEYLKIAINKTERSDRS